MPDSTTYNSGSGRIPSSPSTNPAATDVLRRAVLLGSIICAAVLVVALVLGLIFAGSKGAWGAVLGAAIGAIFMSVTALSIIFGNRFAGSPMFAPVFFSIVLGGWIAKFAIFLVLALLLRDQLWLNSSVLFLTLIATVIASLVVDVIVLSRSRMPYVDVKLPGSSNEL